MAKNKIIYDGNTLIDLTGDTVTASSLLTGYTAHDRSGDVITGTAVPESTFVVTLSYNSTSEKWEPNHTYAEIQAAYNAGKQIVVETAGDFADVQVSGLWDDSNNFFTYWVIEYKDNTEYWQVYTLNSTGITLGDSDTTVHPIGDINITQSGETNVAGYATATVPSGDLGSASYQRTKSQFYHITKFFYSNATVGYYDDISSQSASSELRLQNETVTPSETSQTVTPTSVAHYLDSVTVDAIPNTYVGSAIDRRSSSDLTASGATVSVPSGYYANNASKAVASGTEGTPTATKGTVSNHAISVTPSVTNSAGYISGGTHTGTAVTVSASELVSGSETKTQNGTYDVTNLAEIVVSVEGGGGGGVQIGKTTKTTASAASSIQFTGLSGNPTSFAITSADDVATNTDGVTQVIFDGTSLHGQTMTTGVTADTGFTKSYSGGTLTVTATTASFLAGDYKLVYTYGGSASDTETADIQVGSGATSITFPVSGRPVYWSCIFKSDFTTSSGYQRVIGVVNDGSSIYGLAMDSSAHAASSWTATYSGGNLTINSQSTNVGGYFHQPGYYQLTYYVDSSAPQYQSKTVTPTTSQQVVTPDSGYDALEQVTVNAMPTGTAGTPTATKGTVTNHSVTVTPSVTNTTGYITGGTRTGTGVTVSASELVSGNLPITSNGTNINVANYSTVSVSVEGGGGESKNTQVVQGTTRTSSSTLTAVGAEMTVSKTGTYDVYWSGFRSNTSSSYTFGTQLFVDNTAYGSENTTWSNHVQNNHLTNVSLTANQKIRVRGRNSRGSSYYIYAPTLVIVES